MDIYEEVTRRIVEQMEQGKIPWHKPWIADGSCVSYATGKPYSLLNQMLLGKPGEYLTFRQGGESRSDDPEPIRITMIFGAEIACKRKAG